MDPAIPCNTLDSLGIPPSIGSGKFHHEVRFARSEFEPEIEAQNTVLRGIERKLPSQANPLGDYRIRSMRPQTVKLVSLWRGGCKIHGIEEFTAGNVSLQTLRGAIEPSE
jgi:hypothetical protein